MRIKILLLFLISTVTVLAQNVETDFDAPDSLFREDQFYFNITYNTLQKRPDGLKQNKFSPGFAVGFLRDMPVNSSRTFAVAAGLGYAVAVYNHNLGIFENSSTTTYQILNADGVSVSKDKLSLHYLELPLELRWRNATPDNHRFWRVHLGVKLSYLFASQYKLVSTEGNLTNSNLKDLQDFHYGLYLSTGWNTWNIYAYYGFNPIFTSEAKIDGQSIDMNTAKFGLMFYIL
ncbi:MULTISPECIES: porin family protein [Flavobacterium]|jgi:hypothetical protein|uniref:porin family protein n=1 Tax=Flavobacterium TaxID=237 RepID=UPI00391D14F9